MMHQISDNQCGRCSHFGGDRHDDEQLVQIRISGQATPETIEACDHPSNASMDLHVTPFGSCAGFEPAVA